MATLVLFTKKKKKTKHSFQNKEQDTLCSTADSFGCFPSDTSATLTTLQPVYPGVYRISLVVTDDKGTWCKIPEDFTLEVCLCDNNNICKTSPPTTTREPIEKPGRLGPAAIGLLFLGLLLLLCEYAAASSCLYWVSAHAEAFPLHGQCISAVVLEAKLGGNGIFRKYRKWHFQEKSEMFKANTSPANNLYL